MISIGSTVPAQMTICGLSKVFTVSIYNPSPFLLTNDTLKLTMPDGIDYRAGTISGATEQNISIANAPVFLLPPIPTLTSLNISFSVAAGCDVMAYISGGGVIENKLRINYTANGSKYFDTHTTSSYIIRQPNLSITTVTNQSYTGVIGTSFQRCISVINGGLGELSEFTFTETHGFGLQINSISAGTWTNAGATETVLFTKADFINVGDGDTLFENGEIITLCEDITILNCISVASSYSAFWGCNGQTCQSSASNANVVFPNLIPNLVATPNGGNIYVAANSCIGQPTPQELKIENIGLGQATNVQLDIFQSHHTGYVNSLGSRIDENSITIQINSSAPVPISPDSTQTTLPLSCMPATSVGRVFLTLPPINGGDIMYIRWNVHDCCYNPCAGTGGQTINGWRYKGTYSNICETPYIIPEAWGRVYSYIIGQLSNSLSPSTLSNGQTGNFSFLFADYYYHNFPAAPGSYWKFDVTLPPCVSYVGNFLIEEFDGSILNPSSVSVSGNTLTATFPGTPSSFTIDKSEVKFDLAANCGSCSGSSGGTVGIEAAFVPDPACGCGVKIACQSTAVNIVCPSACPEGMFFSNFDLKRTTYGLPDNEPGGGDGIPDATGTLDFSKIRPERAMFGDILTSTFRGQVITSGTHPSWPNCYASSSITNGNLLSFSDAQLLINRGGTLFASCSGFIPVVNTSGTTRDFFYDLSAPALIASGCVPAGFAYQNGDELVFQPRYKVTVNTQGPVLNCYATNQFFLSNVANPSSSQDKYYCNDYNGNCSVMGYYFTTSGPDDYSVKSCDQLTLSQNYYLSIGPCCTNYNSGNLFPYEYRNWAHIDTLTAIIPYGYEYVSARFIEYRTKGTHGYSTSPYTNLTPLNAGSDTLKFSVEEFYQGYGGTIPMSDDGFVGTLEVTIIPSCEVTPIASLPVQYDWTFATVNSIAGDGAYNTFISYVQDHITYQAPQLFLQAALPSILVPGNTGTWDVSISNITNSAAMNTWLAGPAIAGVSIIEIFDVNNNTIILPSSGGIYKIGTVAGGAVRNFKIKADFTSCYQDSITIHAGWNCNAGYPSDLTSYPCTTKQMTLKLLPLMPTLVVDITSPAGTVDLCTPATYTVEGRNVQLGTAYEVLLSTILPIGVSIVPGSSMLKYPESGAFTAVSDPVSAGGTIWQWSIPSLNNAIAANGLYGILDTAINSFFLRFQVTTDCNYTSGSAIGFDLTGLSSCGSFTGQNVTMSSELGITGATPPYQSTVGLSTTYISPCADLSVMKVSIFNQGAATFTNTDSVMVQLPVGVSYISGSFSGIHNAPSNTVPILIELNGSTYLYWGLPAGVTAGDSVVFSFSYQGNPDPLSCNISDFKAQATASANVLCVSSGINCNINVVTGDSILPVYTYMGYLELSSGSGSSIPNPPSGETVTVSFDLINTGQVITSGANSTIQFYYDANGNEVFDLPDVFLAQDTITISNNDTVFYTHTFDAPAGQTCSIIAIVDTAANPCVCNPSQIFIDIPMSSGYDTSLCTGNIMNIGYEQVNGYGYSWTPANDLSSTSVANPVLTAPPGVLSAYSVTYTLLTDRMGCSAADSVVVTIYPLPIVTLGSNSPVCEEQTLELISSGGESFLWSGPGGFVSSLQNPSINNIPLTGAGYYKVIVTDSNACINTDSVMIAVNPLPEPYFSSSIVCFTNATQFTDLSLSGIVSWEWNFGDSISDIQQHPAHTYGESGYHNVSLAVEDNFGCRDTVTKQALVNPVPVVSFFADNVCAYDTAYFADSSTISSGTFTREWDFGDATASLTDQNPAHWYGASGSYDVKLVLTSDSGCTDSVMKMIYIHPVPAADFTFADNCLYDTSFFADASSISNGTIDGRQWDFGVSTSSAANPFHIYSESGTHPVMLVVTSDSGCVDTIIKTTEKFPIPFADFNPTIVCLNDTTPFSDLSTVSTGFINNWIWSFGDGSSNQYQQHPNHLYELGNYNVTLVVVSDKNCFKDTAKEVGVYPLPEPSFGFSNNCLNEQPVLFSDSSSILSGNFVVSWEWDFEQGTSGASVPNPAYTFSSPGTYPITLVVTSDKGCTDTLVESIIIHPDPQVEFTANITAGCEPLCIELSDNSTILTGNLSGWEWNHGNGTSSQLQNPTACYLQDGNYTVSLIVTSDHGCKDTLVKTDYITLWPLPIADFSAAPQPATIQDMEISFSDLSSGSLAQWNWTFFDNDSNKTKGQSDQQNPVFDFSSHPGNPFMFFLEDTGKYPVQLIITTTDGCKDTLVKNVLIDGVFYLNIPNAFSPGGSNGINDYFFPSGIGIEPFRDFNFYVFDRWGDLIFESHSLDSPWDGTCQGKLVQQGVYVWLLEVMEATSQHPKHKYVGHVTVVR